MSEKAVFEPLRGFYLAWSISAENLSDFCQFALCWQNFVMIFVQRIFYEISIQLLCTQVKFLC